MLIVVDLIQLSDPCFFIKLSFQYKGKTVYGKLKQFGRSMRHKQVTKCAVGAFAFYLFFRFHISREMDDGNRPDFTKNEAWYNIKILTDGTRNNTKEMGKQTYTDDVREIFRDLKIAASHFGHWGRVSGPVELEFNEVSPDLIRILGELPRCLCWLIVVLFVKKVLTHLLQVIGIPKLRMLDIRPSCL